MLKQVYVVDLMVRDLDKAVAFFRAVMGVNPIDTTGVGSGVSEFRAAHFPAPGGGVGVHSIGLFQLTTNEPKTPEGIRAKKFLDEHGEGVSLLGFTVDDIDATKQELEDKGLAFRDAAPLEYEMGRGLHMEDAFGTTLWFAEHHPDGYEKFRSLDEVEPSS